ncbi:ISLre2 family transposase [Streptococcus agalactiae]|nr:ISLre2 family transposase [Streptococcus agalactiae]
MAFFEESKLRELLARHNAKHFEEYIYNYDESMIPVMRARGYQCIHSMERTVAFTFGEFTFRRRRWKKGNEWVVPVDDMLGLPKNVRFSWEFMYQVAHLATIMAYDKVVQVIEVTKGICITKPTVVKAVKLCTQLIQEKADYRFYEDDSEIEKKKVDTIYIEGDGVMIKAKSKDSDNNHFDFSHFVVHTGSRKIGSNRFELQDKKEFISLDNRQTREQVLDYLYNHFEITEETLLVTNSDGGHGYTPYIFKEIAKTLKINRHEHFWDEYHVNQKLNTFFKPYPEELLEQAYQAVYQHDKQALRLVLDTTESLLATEAELEVFQSFKKKLLQSFQYTKPAPLRGFSHAGIGVMETQHRKITYRMKHRGMYWTMQGAETMTQMILLVDKGELYNLFLGSWRDEYAKYEALESQSISDWLKEDQSPSQLPQAKTRGLFTTLRN